MATTMHYGPGLAEKKILLRHVLQHKEKITYKKHISTYCNWRAKTHEYDNWEATFNLLKKQQVGLIAHQNVTL